MDLESECWVDQSLGENEGITTDSLSERLRSLIESKVQNTNDLLSERLRSLVESKVQTNGSCVVKSNGKNVLNQNGKLNHKGAEEYERVEFKREASSPLHKTMRKGHGLKKWRRFRRDMSRDGPRSIGPIEMVAEEPRDQGANRSKRAQYAERKQKSEGSVSSTNAVVRSSDGYALLDDSGLAVGTDSENSEDRSSKSSTAATALKTKYDIPVIGGFPCDTSKMSSLNGVNLTHPLVYGHCGKGRTETGKKARGEGVKIEKENSHSSVESDSRSSKFVFMQGTLSGNNGVQSEGTNEYDGENGDEVHGVNDGHQGYEGDGREGFESLSHVADSSWGDKDECIRALQSAQQALEEEVLKFKEIRDDVSVDGSVSELCSEYIDVEQKLQETRGEDPQIDSQILQSEVLETEVEELFKQQIEAEVEYLAISRMVQQLRVAAVDQITLLNDYKALASEQTHILHKFEDAENKAALLKKEAEKLERSCDEIANAEELLGLQKRVGKYGSCFALQLVVLLVLFFGGFILSQDYVDVVPT